MSRKFDTSVSRAFTKANYETGRAFSSFGETPIKMEGTPVTIDGESAVEYQGQPTTYVERCVPEEYEKEIHDMIDTFLISKGYSRNEL